MLIGTNNVKIAVLGYSNVGKSTVIDIIEAGLRQPGAVREYSVVDVKATHLDVRDVDHVRETLQSRINLLIQRNVRVAVTPHFPDNERGVPPLDTSADVLNVLVGSEADSSSIVTASNRSICRATQAVEEFIRNAGITNIEFSMFESNIAPPGRHDEPHVSVSELNILINEMAAYRSGLAPKVD